MFDSHIEYEHCLVNDLLKLCLWLKSLKVDTEKIRQWTGDKAFEPATTSLISVFALDDWSIPPGSFADSMKAFQGRKAELSSDYNAITSFKWLYENRDKSPEVVSFIKSLHDSEYVWLELTSRARSVHRPIIDWV